MFSISLPMQRISASMQKKIVELQSFRHYIHPALDFRTENDHVRSTRHHSRHNSVRDINVANALDLLSADGFQRSRNSSRVNLASIVSDDSQNSINVGDVETISLQPFTQLSSQKPQTQPQQSSHASTRTITPTVQSAWDDRDRANSKVVSVIDAVEDFNHRIVNLSQPLTRCSDDDDDDDDDDDTAVHYRVLVVDDSPLNRKMLSKLLKSKGYNIEEAADGQIAVDKVKLEADAGRHYDVILMDFLMPVMDGPAATRAIRAMRIRTPIFGLTGSREADTNYARLYTSPSESNAYCS